MFLNETFVQSSSNSDISLETLWFYIHVVEYVSLYFKVFAVSLICHLD